jgi:hypothetical protein
MSDAVQRIIRTIIQLIAGGLLTLLATQLNTDLAGSAFLPYLTLLFAALTSVAQNEAEERGWIPIILKKEAK